MAPKESSNSQTISRTNLYTHVFWPSQTVSSPWALAVPDKTGRIKSWEQGSSLRCENKSTVVREYWLSTNEAQSDLNWLPDDFTKVTVPTPTLPGLDPFCIFFPGQNHWNYVIQIASRIRCRIGQVHDVCTCKFSCTKQQQVTAV
jgi:hypothetical protein